MASCCAKLCQDKGHDGLSSIKKDRGCTDIIPLLVFLASFGILVYIYYEALSLGSNYQRVLHGVDAYGNICGVSDSVKDQAYAAYPYPYTLSLDKPMICVKNCVETFDGTNLGMTALYPSTDLLFYCIPTPVSNLSVSIKIEGEFNNNIMNAYESVARSIGDVWFSRDVLMGSVGVAAFATLVYCVFLRTCAKTMIYTLLFLIIAFGLMFAQLLLNFAASVELEEQTLGTTYPDGTVEWMERLGYAVMVLTGLFAFCVFFLRTQIDIAIEVTREAAKSVLDMQTIVLFPIIPAACVFVYGVFWSFIAMHVYSIADKLETAIPVDERTYDASWIFRNATMIGQLNPNLPDSYPVSSVSEDLEKRAGFMVFHAIWVLQFFFYFGYMVFAGAVADWYFTATDENGHKKRGNDPNELSRFPVISSVYRTLRYHCGTIAVCSFIIAVVKFTRYVITYIEHKTKGEPPNGVQKAVFCVIKCCLRCLECCLDKINKYALVWTSIYGDNFCVSACSSFALVWRNLFRVAALNVVSNVIFFMGKISVALGSASVVCLFIQNAEPYKSNVTSPLVPSFLVLFVAYFVAACFFVMFSCTIDTLFLCFLVDSEVNQAGSMMAPPALQKLVGKYEKNSKNRAQLKMKNRQARNGNDGSVGNFHKDHQGGDFEMVEG